jgi:2-amino-4-hydroxy-6-hydroxymethyldihydropteridine diphosphokinase
LKERQKTSPEWAFVSIGSNIEPERYLPLAFSQLLQLGRMLKTSRVYQNPAVGRSEQADFLNAAALLETELTALEIRNGLRGIEAILDRVRTEDPFAPRTMDLDLCLLGNQIMDTPEITLPDPDLLIHAYLAIPMAELAPNFEHPVTGETLQQIAKRLQPMATLILREDVTREVKQAVKSQR